MSSLYFHNGADADLRGNRTECMIVANDVGSLNLVRGLTADGGSTGYGQGRQLPSCDSQEASQSSGDSKGEPTPLYIPW